MGIGKNATTTQTTAADPTAAAAYRNLLGQAQGVASTPYQAYQGELVAPVNAQQNLGIGNINANAGFAAPAVNQAIGLASGASNPLTASQIANYQNPYTQSVVDATQAQFNNQNAQQQAALKGNQISQGALGGNRVGIGAANLANQQQAAQAPVIAGLYNQSYNQALQTAAQQYQQNPLAAAGSLANFGISGQNAALTGANAQLGAGTLQQQTQQAADTANYGQFAQQQAYPFQTAQWLAGIEGAIGPQLGGTAQTQGPTPNTWAQLAGLGIAGAGLFLNRGGAVHRDGGGQVSGMPYGISGGPWSIGKGWVPTSTLHGGQLHVSGPSAPSGQSADNTVKQVQGFVDKWNKSPGDAFSGPSYGGGNMLTDAWGGSSAQPLAGLSAADYGEGYARGGKVAGFARGYADGGTMSDAYPGGFEQTPFDQYTADKMAAARDVQSFYKPGADMSGLDAAINRSNALNNFQNIPPSPSVNPDTMEHWSDLSPAMRTKINNASLGYRTRSDGGRNYADGGTPTMDDRFAPVLEAIKSGDFDPQGANSTEFTGTPGMQMANSGTVPLPAARPAAAPVVAKDEEDDEEVAPKAGLGAPAQPMARDSATAGFAPAAAAEPARSGFGLGYLSPNVKQSLLAAGLGMLASKSPYFGNALGEGGLQGLNAYSSAQAAEQKAAQEQLKNRMEQQRIDREAAALQETIRHNKASEAKEFKPTWSVIGERQNPDTGMNEKVYGWVDPNKKAITDASGKPVTASTSATPTAAAPILDAQGKPITGQGALDTMSPQRATLAKQIGDYKINPNSLSVRGGHREQAIADATRYNPDYDQRFYTGSSRAMSNFMGGPEGRTIRSLNVAIDHLNTLDEAGKALNNGNIPKLNSIVNAYRQNTGSPLTTNFDSIKQVVSAEIAKAVVGGQTALHDRDDMAQRASNAQSPEQIAGIITEFKKLMAGQMKGLRKQYEVSTRAKNFDDYLEEGTRKELDKFAGVKESWKSPTEGGGAGFQPQPGDVKQNGYWYRKGSAGAYEAVAPAQ